ncbi:MAG: methyltransferase domain-containing protein [Gammaproteobacteria bacterium]|nr:methyltransferase domain-containing protein [Gammaproteobacteria bacterium]
MIKPFKPYAPEQPWLPFSEVLLDWDEDFHQLMLCDHIRMVAYESAIRSQVRPGQVVVDLGTGTGILALWALQAGAGRVYGIDLDADVLELATQRIHAHGFADRFEAVNRLSYDVVLPEPADVLISEIIGNVGDNEDFQPILQDAIARLLKPGGTVIPEAVETFIVPVEAIRTHQDIGNGSVATLNGRYQFQQLLRQKNIRNPFNLYYDAIIPTQQHLADVQQVKRYDGNWQQAPQYSRALDFTVTTTGTLTGFKGFFRAQLAPQVILDISSGDIGGRKCSDSWKHCFFPIEQPLAVEQGDRIELRFERRYPHDQAPFRQIYSWHGQVVPRNASATTTANVAREQPLQFRQSMDEAALAGISLSALPALDAAPDAG